MQNTDYENMPYDDGIDIKELFFALWDRKFIIISITTVFAISSVFIALSLPNIYSSKALLSPSGQQDSLSSTLGSFSGLAGMAGISLPGDAGDPSQEAMSRIRSLEFFSKHIKPNINLENLIAVKEWKPNGNKLVYDDKIYDSENNKWVRKVRYPKSTIPSDQEAYNVYKRIISISEDRKTKFVALSVEHKSPYIAKKWVDLIIKSINESMREEDKNLAIKSIEFLNESSSKTNLNDIKEAMSELLEKQIQNLMFASANEFYVYKIIDSPVVPELKSKPNRALFCIVGTLLGGILSVIIALIMFYVKKES